MTLSKFIEGLQIAQKYYDKPDGYHLCAEHDEVLLYPTNKPMTKDDEEQMRKLGWRWKDEAWAAFV